MRKRAFILLGVIVILILGIAVLPDGVPTNIRESRVEIAKKNITLVIGENPDEQQTFIVPVREDASLFQLMRDAESQGLIFEYKEFPGLGSLIEKIGEIKNSSGGKYWQYWINGEYAKVGAEGYVPKPGDIIEWKFVGQQNF